jgi:tyrosine-protein kinase Etk/Wzc
MEQVPDTAQIIAPTEVTVSILDLLLILIRRWKFLLGFTCVCLLLSLLVALLLRPTFTATTSILPPQQATSSASMMLSQLGGQSPLASGLGLNALKTSEDLYVGLMKSTSVENEIIRRFNLMREDKVSRMSDARKILEQQTTIDGSQKDGIIRISVRSHSAERAAELANGYVEAYTHLSASLAIGEASQRRLFLSQQLASAKDNLASAEETLKKTELSGGVIQLDSQAKALIESAGSLRAEIAAKEVQLQSMRTYAGAENPQLLQAQQELAGLREQLAKLSGSGDSENGLTLSRGQLPAQALQYVRNLREVKYNETIFDMLARQYEAARLDEAKEGAVVQVIDRATPPDRKSGPPRLLIVVVGTLLGAIFAILWVILASAQRYFKRTAEYRALTRAFHENSTS